MKRIFLLLLGALLLAGCSSMAPAPDKVGIRYSGGSIFPAQQFKTCQPGGTREFGAPGDHTYEYLMGLRDFKFSNDPGSDAPPLTALVPSPAGPNGEPSRPVSLSVSGTITFQPAWVNPDGSYNCAVLQRFHEQLGIKYEAWTPGGWAKHLGVYLKDPADAAVDQAGREFDWVTLTGDPSAKQAWAEGTIALIPALAKQQTGTDSYFLIRGMLLQAPALPADMQNAINESESVKVRALAQTEAARQQAKTATVLKEAGETFPGGLDAMLRAQQQSAITDAIRNGQVKVIPVQPGQPIIIGGGN